MAQPAPSYHTNDDGTMESDVDPVPMPDPARLIPLIREDADGNLIAAESGLEYLSSIKSPIGVVSMCGRRFQGKTYLGNEIFRQIDQSPKGVLEETWNQKGVWMWNKPISQSEESGTILLLDFPGTTTHGTIETKYNSLSLLLSSLLLYNFKGLPHDVFDLVRIVESTKWWRLFEQRSSLSLRHILPSFCYVVRDYSTVSGTGYVANALRDLLRTDGTPETKMLDQWKTLVANSFTTLDCVTVVSPQFTHDFAGLWKVSADKLKPEFIEDVRKLRDYISENTRRKEFLSITMTGPIVVVLIRLFIQLINEHDGTTAIQTLWQRAHMEVENNTKKLCENALLNAKITYTDEVKGCREEVARKIKALAESFLRSTRDIMISGDAYAVEKAIAVYDAYTKGDMCVEMRNSHKKQLDEYLRDQQKELQTQLHRDMVQQITFEAGTSGHGATNHL